MSLRGRLLLATGILVVLGLLVADGATYGLLRGSLISRVDAQLVSYSHDPRGRARGRVGKRPDHGLPQQYIEFIDASGNKLISQPILGADYPPKVPANLFGSRTPATGYRIVTTPAVGSPGKYRVIVLPAELGGPNVSQGTTGTGIIAISLADVEATLHRLLFVELLVTLSVIAAAGGAAWWLIRKGLQPLTEMEGAAADI